MPGTALLDLQQRLARLSEAQRRDVLTFLIRLGEETPAWKKGTAKRLDEMAGGKQVSVAPLRKQLGHA